MIEHIKLQNFKSLVGVDLELKPLNVLIGQNGSGKSNFLSFFRLLKEAANERFNLAINSMGGTQNIIHYESEAESWLWHLTYSKGFSNSFPSTKPSYIGRIERRSNSDYYMDLEQLLYNNPENDMVKYYLSGGVFEGLVSVDGSSFPGELNSHELAIAQIRDPSRYPPLAEMRTTLADYQIYHGFGEEALRNMRGPQLFTPVDPLRLDPLGRNLLSVVQELANVRRYEKIYERLINAMKTVFPDFIKLYTPTSAGGMGSLFYGSEYFEESIPALNMSDGQLRFLGLVIILLLADLPNPPSLILIDEPEIGMHPKMIEVFAELLIEASKKTQIIITTHSPRLLDFVPQESVVIVENQGGKTTLERLNKPNLDEWLEQYSLGKLWTMGALSK